MRKAIDADRDKNDTGARVRAVRHLRRPEAPGRRHRALGISRAPQALVRSRGARLDVVGPGRSRLVDGRAVRRRLVPLRAGHGTRVCRRRGRSARRGDVLHRVAVLHLGRLPPVPRGGRRRAPAARYRPAQGLRIPAPPDRLARDGCAVHRHHRVQRQHLRRHLGGRRLGAGAASCLATRRVGLGLLPGRQRARLVRGVPRLGGLAPRVTGLVDHRVEPGRVGRVRFLRHRELRGPRDEPGAERPGGQPRHLRGRGVLPQRRGADALRADRGGTSPLAGCAALGRPSGARSAVTDRETSSDRSDPGRSCGAGPRCPG
jgi:hypothetical protein